MLLPSFVIPDAGGSTPGFKISHSLRFNGSSSRMNAATKLVNYTYYTWNGWVKFGTIGTAMCIIGAVSATAMYVMFNLNADGTLEFYGRNSSSIMQADYRSVEKLLDPTAFYNIHLVVNNTAAAGERIRIWVNGIELNMTVITELSASGNTVNSPDVIGSRSISSAYALFANMEAAQLYRIDGQVLPPTDFGEFDSFGKWVPKEYAGTFTGGSYFYKFNDGATSTRLGIDSSGLANDAAMTGFTRAEGSSECWMTDTPTDNYCTLDPLYVTGTVSFGALTYTTGATTAGNARGTVGMTSGKWWWEHQGANSNSHIGICNANLAANLYPATSINAWIYLGVNGKKCNGAQLDYGATFGATDIVGVLFDADARTLEFFKQTGTGEFISQGVAFTGLPAGTYFPLCNTGSAAATTMYENFGQRKFKVESVGYSRGGSVISGIPDGAKALTAENASSASMALSGNSYYSGSGPVLWMNGVPDTVTFNSVLLTYPADFTRLAVGAKILKTHTAGNYNWSATVLDATDSKFVHQNAHVK